MKILVVAPHADDEVLGMGGTIARFAREGHNVIVAVLTGHGNEGPHPLGPKSLWDKVRAEAREAHTLLGVEETIFSEIPAVFVADQPVWRLNKNTAELIDRVRPEILFVPFLFDLHKDHRELFHSFSVAWRPCTETGRAVREIYTYEVPSETHLNAPYLEQSFSPNMWVDISETLSVKLDALRSYKSQIREAPDLRSLETVEALARLRGSQMGAAAAEAFVLVRRFQ